MVATMTMVSDRVLSPTELRALSGRATLRAPRGWPFMSALLAGTGWLVAISGPVDAAPAMVAFGLVQVALFAPAHEATHQTAFASRRANLIVGWLAAARHCSICISTPRFTSRITGTRRSGQDPSKT